MNKKCFYLVLTTILALAPLFANTPYVKATNEGSYLSGFWSGSNTGPNNNSTLNNYPNFDNNTCSMTHFERQIGSNGMVVMPAVTNRTACEDGFFNGYKQWCNKHALDCVQNITSGEMPPMLMQVHHEYVKGSDAANSSGNPICPIGENAVFCQGWGDNAGYDDEGCADTPTGNVTVGLVGCPEDIMTETQLGGLPALVGNWHFVNESNAGSEIRGTFLFNNNGYMRMSVPNKTSFGDYVPVLN